jgi:predicted HicB family RNase H-like nuclease
MARINIDLPAELHRKAKAAAALAGISLRQFVIEAITDAVRRAKSR